MQQLKIIEKHIGSTDIRDISKVLTAVYLLRKMVRES